MNLFSIIIFKIERRDRHRENKNKKKNNNFVNLESLFKILIELNKTKRNLQKRFFLPNEIPNEHAHKKKNKRKNNTNLERSNWNI